MLQYFWKALCSSVLIMAVLLSGYRFLCAPKVKPGDSITVFVRYGDYGDTVIEIKERLRALGYEISSETPVYDLQTAEAVRRFQEASGLVANGIVTPETLSKLGLTNELESLIAYERERFLATVIDAVIPDAPYLVRVALAGIILKRCETVGFSNDPVSVVFGEPSLRDAYLGDFVNEPSHESRQAVIDALEGMSPCPEALYFYRSETVDTFLKQRNVVYRNGSYIFAI